MTFISYAQNFEDVMLWRALKNIDKGFYIDIGAQDPIDDSVSFAFNKIGWSGCHVEPTSQYSTKLKLAHPGDVVMQLAIGEGVGEISFFEIQNSGLSTTDSKIAAEHVSRGFTVLSTTVAVITLDNLLNQFIDREIHWLKIDVEGAEANVISSWTSSKVRPWILVIESTKPLTQIECYDTWEPLILEKGYEFVYFDGLNRFYISIEHLELKHAFKVPPNIFDDFEFAGIAPHPFLTGIKARSLKAIDEARQAEEKARQAEDKTQQAETKALQAEAKALQAEDKALLAKDKAQQAELSLALILKSSSWRMMAPLRKIKKIFQF